MAKYSVQSVQEYCALGFKLALKLRNHLGGVQNAQQAEAPVGRGAYLTGRYLVNWK